MKRKLQRWAYAAVGLVIMITAMAVFAPREEKNADTAEEVAVAAYVEPDALVQFCTEQEQLRSMQLSQLDDIINSEKSSQELIDRAQAEKIDITERMEQEQLVAGILRARGYTNAAAVVGDDHITIMVRAGQLGETDAARITELVLSQSGIAAENIKIIPIN